MSRPDFDRILAELDQALLACASRDQAAQLAMEKLAAGLDAYRWVGVYWLNGETLELGPYVGAATDHTRIPVGRGVCGAAVAERRNIVVEDVGELDNYLSCSLETKSEIVVLIRDETGRILGQIDVDGHDIAAFDEQDEAFLDAVARRIAAFPE